MDILKLLKEGMSADEIYDDFMDALEDAQTEYKQYLERLERQRQALAARDAEREFKQKRIETARSALGSAMVEYFSALDLTVDEKTYENIDWIIDALPHIKIVKTGGKFW